MATPFKVESPRQKSKWTWNNAWSAFAPKVSTVSQVRRHFFIGDVSSPTGMTWEKTCLHFLKPRSNHKRSNSGSCRFSGATKFTQILIEGLRQEAQCQDPRLNPTSRYWTLECPRLWMKDCGECNVCPICSPDTSTTSQLLRSSGSPDAEKRDVEPYSVLF